MSVSWLARLVASSVLLWVVGVGFGGPASAQEIDPPPFGCSLIMPALEIEPGFTTIPISLECSFAPEYGPGTGIEVEFYIYDNEFPVGSDPRTRLRQSVWDATEIEDGWDPDTRSLSLFGQVGVNTSSTRWVRFGEGRAIHTIGSRSTAPTTNWQLVSPADRGDMCLEASAESVAVGDTVLISNQCSILDDRPELVRMSLVVTTPNGVESFPIPQGTPPFKYATVPYEATTPGYLVFQADMFQDRSSNGDYMESDTVVVHVEGAPMPECTATTTSRSVWVGYELTLDCQFAPGTSPGSGGLFLQGPNTKFAATSDGCDQDTTTFANWLAADVANGWDPFTNTLHLEYTRSLTYPAAPPIRGITCIAPMYATHNPADWRITGAFNRNDVVMVVDNEVTQPPVSSAYAAEVIEDGPVAYWRMDSVEPDGRVLDEQGTSDGSTLKPPAQVAGLLAGEPGSALDLAAAPSGIGVVDGAGSLFSNEFTLEAWVDVADHTARAVPILHSAEAGYSLSHVAVGSGSWFQADIRLVRDLDVDPIIVLRSDRHGILPVTSGTHHVVVSRDRFGAYMYVDGRLVDSTVLGSSHAFGITSLSPFRDPYELPGDGVVYTEAFQDRALNSADIPGGVTWFPSSPRTFVIGGDSVPAEGNDGPFTGVIDEVAVYDKALTEHRIKAHYSVGANGESPKRFVSLGDSFQSGEGAGDQYYYQYTDDPESNMCHRSVVNYAHLLADSALRHLAHNDVTCSGAQTTEFRRRWQWPTQPAQLVQAFYPHLREYEPPAQLQSGDDVDYVTVGIGGNDIGFGPIVQSCLLAPDSLRELKNLILGLGTIDDPWCGRLQSVAVAEALGRLPDRLDNEVYDPILKLAPNADVLVVGYPGMVDGANGCQGLTVGEQRWAVQLTNDLNTTIASTVADSAAAAAAVAGNNANIRFVDITDTVAGHELCSPDPWFTLLSLPFGDDDTQELLHPTPEAHQAAADRITQYLLEGDPPISAPGLLSGRASTSVAMAGLIDPGETQTASLTVPPVQRVLFHNTWPGSDIEMTLITPSGQQINRSTVDPDIAVAVGPTYERFDVTNPEPGTWTVEAFGADVAVDEPFRVVATSTPLVNESPVPVVVAEVDGSVITLDASGSFDPDGSVVSYEWEISDGTALSGPVVSHTVTDDGVYVVNLIVTDDQGRIGFERLDPIEVGSIDSSARGAREDIVEFISVSSLAGDPVAQNAWAGVLVPTLGTDYWVNENIIDPVRFADLIAVDSMVIEALAGFGDSIDAQLYAHEAAEMLALSDLYTVGVMYQTLNPTIPVEFQGDIEAWLQTGIEALAQGDIDAGFEIITLLHSDLIQYRDIDADGLNDAEEINYGTDPTKPDTDGDGITDLDEVNNSTNPTDPADPPPLAIEPVQGPSEPTQLGQATTLVVNVNSVVEGTVTFDWADTSTTAALVDGSATGQHSYQAPGVYSVGITVELTNGQTASTDFEYVVVFDPNGGFVTAGGWITSPIGAYPADPSLTGKATFGLVSKYKKGRTIPDGNTQFHFNTAGFRFQSTSYEWLVVAGARAQYKGVGEVNEQPGYGFMVTVIDGDIFQQPQADRFRIKIWEIGTEVIIYDNQLGADDTADASTALGGGSVQIHDNKK